MFLCKKTRGPAYLGFAEVKRVIILASLLEKRRFILSEALLENFCTAITSIYVVDFYTVRLSQRLA